MYDIKESDLEQFFSLNWDLYKEKLKEQISLEEKLSFNIISVSTYTGHLENYHSDIWGFLLDNKAAHNKGDFFLSLFIDYLVENKKINSKYVETLKKAEVHREKGRIDILIVNKEEQICVIIENKINNAEDQVDQLKRYNQYALNNKWEVAALLYVTATGDWSTSIQDDVTIVHSLAAYNNENDSLLKGWLLKCKTTLQLAFNEVNEDAFSFIHQYCSLLKHLTSKTLSNMSIEILYKNLQDKNNLQTALYLESELKNISLHRLNLFLIKIQKVFDNKVNYFQPAFDSKKTFDKQHPNYMSFQFFKYNGLKFQLDINLFHFKTRFNFYNSDNKIDSSAVKVVLNELIGENNFERLEGSNPGHTAYVIALSNEIDSLALLEDATLAFAELLFKSMNNYTEKLREANLL